MVAMDCAKKLSQSGQRCATLLSDIASLVESILPEYECIITNDCWSQLVSHFLCQTVAGSLPLKMEDYRRVLAQRLAVTVWMPRTRIEVGGWKGKQKIPCRHLKDCSWLRFQARVT